MIIFILVKNRFETHTPRIFVNLHRRRRNSFLSKSSVMEKEEVITLLDILYSAMRGLSFIKDYEFKTYY